MTHLITYVRREGQAPIAVNAPGFDEQTARTMAGMLANLSSRVTLSELDADGVPQVIASWKRGGPNPRVIDHDGTDVADALADEITAESQSIEEAAAESDAELQTHNAYCMKCHEKRDVTGHVGIAKNGRLQFTGPCPVCGTNVFRFLPNEAPQPEPEWTDEDPAEETAESEEFTEDEEPTPGIIHALQKDDAGRGKVRLFCTCDEWETTVKAGSAAETRAIAAFSEHEADATEVANPDGVAMGEEPIPIEESDEDAGAEVAAEVIAAVADAVPEGTPVAEMAEAATIAAVEFSHAAEEAENPGLTEPPAPKPGSKKAAAKKAPAKKATTAAKAEAAKATEPVKKAAPRKRTNSGADNRTPNQKAAANPIKGMCPSCEEEVDIIERAGLQIYTFHPDQKHGLDRCAMSTAQVPGT